MTITSLLRRHLSHRLWRAVHWGAWLLWPLAVVHSLGAGSDTRHGWGLVVVVACVAGVGAAAIWRIVWAVVPAAGARSPGPSGVPVVAQRALAEQHRDLTGARGAR